LLDERSCSLLLADGSGSYQPAHIERSGVELVVASAFLCQGEPLKLSAQRSKSIGSGPLWHSSGPLWTALWDKELHEPIRRGCEFFSQRVDPAVSMTIWMDRRRSEYIAPSPSEIDSWQNGGTIPQPSGLHVPMEAVACPNNWALYRFSPGPCAIKGSDRVLAIKINDIEAEAGSQSEVGRRMRVPPGLDHVRICCGVMESAATVASWNQRHLRTRRQREDVDAGRCVGECSGEVVHGFSLIRHRVNARRTMNDDDKSRSFALFDRTKISGFDPLLPTVWPAYPA
jgi:hypothetical protein